MIGYGVQGPGQSLNLRDNGFRVIVGQREGTRSWERAVADGWVPGETLFGIEEAASRATIIEYLLSDAGQIAVWPALRRHLTRARHSTSPTVSASPSATGRASYRPTASM